MPTEIKYRKTLFFLKLGSLKHLPFGAANRMLEVFTNSLPPSWVYTPTVIPLTQEASRSSAQLCSP
jgi:hypothetical protein